MKYEILRLCLFNLWNNSSSSSFPPSPFASLFLYCNHYYFITLWPSHQTVSIIMLRFLSGGNRCCFILYLFNKHTVRKNCKILLRHSSNLCTFLNQRTNNINNSKEISWVEAHDINALARKTNSSHRLLSEKYSTNMWKIRNKLGKGEPTSEEYIRTESVLLSKGEKITQPTDRSIGRAQL